MATERWSAAACAGDSFATHAISPPVAHFGDAYK
jgi:hypothetical protein